jgi:3-oxoacyl-[acyl-carrier-protein] synthase II
MITGCGAVTSVGTSAAGTWSAVLAGTSGIGPVERFATDGYACSSAALVFGVSAETAGVGPRDAWIMGLPALMLLVSGREAMAQAGLHAAPPEPDEIGFFAGMGMVDPTPEDLGGAVLASREPAGIDYRRFFGDGYREIHPLWPLVMLNNVGFCLAALHLGVRGDNAVFSPGADSALLALAEASAAVESSRTAATLSGGASERVSPESLARAHIVGGWDRPGARCALGEGAAALVVERESVARARGAVPLAAVAGWGFSHAASAREGFEAAMTSAIERAGQVVPADAVVLHDESCGEAARAEREAVATVLQGQTRPPALLSSKKMLGHALAGGAAVDIALATRMLGEGFVPRSLAEGAWGPGPSAGPMLARAGARPRRVLVNARGWSGACGCVVLDAAS